MKNSLSKTTRVRKDETSTIEPFVYGQPSGPGGLKDKSRAFENGGGFHSSGNMAFGANGSGAEIEEEIKARALERGLREGEARARSEFERALAAAIENFSAERDTYFRKVEAEVVQLSLAIARKILFRESQIDPLLLTGVIRVALEKVATSSTVKLRVHPAQAPLWQDYFSRNPGMPMVPEIVGDASLELSQCMLETSMGVTDLSPETHLKEIEQGFFDLLSHKPQNFDTPSPAPIPSPPQSEILRQQSKEAPLPSQPVSPQQTMTEPFSSIPEEPLSEKREEKENAPAPTQAALPQQGQAEASAPVPTELPPVNKEKEKEGNPEPQAPAQATLPEQKNEAPAASQNLRADEPKGNGKGRKRK